MSAPVYFDTSVFLAIFNGEPEGPDIKALLKELKRDKVKICTSIVTVQEVSVLSYRRGTLAADNHSKVNRLARIHGLDKEIVLTAAKFEAQLKDLAKSADPKAQQEDNRRRKWDCFHIATAVSLQCSVLYATDEKLLKRKEQLGIAMEFSKPVPSKPTLFPEGAANTAAAPN